MMRWSRQLQEQEVLRVVHKLLKVLIEYLEVVSNLYKN